MITAEDKAAIREHMGSVYGAFLSRDADALQRLFADDFTFCDRSGRAIATKEQWIRDLGTGELTFEAIDQGELEIEPSGDDARIRGNATLRSRYPRGNYNGNFRFVGLYTRRSGQWQLLLMSAQQVTNNPDRAVG